MYLRANYYFRACLSAFGGRCDSVVCRCRSALHQCCRRQRKNYLAGLLLVTLSTHSILAQEKSLEPSKGNKADILALPQTWQQQTSPAPGKRSITVEEAVAIFLNQNLQLVAARYDIDTVDAEKLTARLRPNPEVSVGFSDIPLVFSGNLLKPQTFSYGISQTFELGGKRRQTNRCSQRKFRTGPGPVSDCLVATDQRCEEEVLRRAAG